MRSASSEKSVSERLALGGTGLSINRGKLLFWFRAGVAAYLGYFYFTVQFRSLEILILTGILILAALSPAYLWCAGKAHGLPIVPVFSLSAFPTYILPIHGGSKVLEQYSQETEVKALLCLIGYLLTLTAVWHQMCNNPRGAPPTCRMLNLQGSTGILVTFLVLGALFQLGGVIFYQFSGGLFTLVRGYTASGAMLAMFVFAYRLGLGTLSPGLKILLFMVVGLLIVTEAATFILAGALVRLAVIGAGYTLGSQKIPWKAGLAVVGILTVLHAGKGEMRETYWKEGQGTQKFGVFDYPRIFMEWFGTGVKTLAAGKTEDDGEVHSAAERGAMIGVFFRILDWTPSRKPFLQGETYKGIPTLLIPRVLYKDKGIAHMGNWILAYQYEFLTAEELGKTSVGFDLISEAYANYGYLGIGFLAVFLALFYGMVGRLSVGVPLLSVRFLFAVLVLSGTLSSNNTLGVFVTTLWQSSMALLTVAFILTKKFPNPLFVKPGGGLQRGGLEEEVVGSSSLQISQHRDERRRVENDSSSPKHERPTRFVYGKTQNK